MRSLLPDVRGANSPFAGLVGSLMMQKIFFSRACWCKCQWWRGTCSQPASLQSLPSAAVTVHLQQNSYRTTRRCRTWGCSPPHTTGPECQELQLPKKALLEEGILPGWTHPRPTIGLEGSLNGLMGMNMTYSVAFAVTRSQPSWTHIGDFGPSCWTALSASIIKTPNEGISCGRKLFHPYRTVPETCRTDAKVHWSCCCSMWWTKTWLKHFNLIFPLICHPSVYVRWHGILNNSLFLTKMRAKISE